MKQYIRIRDIKEPTFDSLENECNKLALDGWVVINITNGDTYRTATLEKDITNEPTQYLKPEELSNEEVKPKSRRQHSK